MILGIDPKIDYAFKKLFGSESNKPLLIALLNAVLRAYLAEPIVDVEILNPFNDKDILGDKLSILDIKARDRNGRLYNIEMEMAAAKAYPKRILYYWSKLYESQLHEGDHYRRLKPTISISFVNRFLFSATGFHHEFAVRSSSQPSFALCEDLSIHVIELPKFLGTIEELKDDLDRWCYFLRYGESLETDPIPDGLNTPPMVKAVEVMKNMTQSEIERERYESRLKAIRDQQFYVESAREEGLEEGLEKGREKGREEGRQLELVNSLETGLELKFGEPGKELFTRIREITDVAKLRTIQQRLLIAQTIDEVRELVKQ